MIYTQNFLFFPHRILFTFAHHELYCRLLESVYVQSATTTNNNNAEETHKAPSHLSPTHTHNTISHT